MTIEVIQFYDFKTQWSLASLQYLQGVSGLDSRRFFGLCVFCSASLGWRPETPCNYRRDGDPASARVGSSCGCEVSGPVAVRVANSQHTAHSGFRNFHFQLIHFQRFYCFSRDQYLQKKYPSENGFTECPDPPPSSSKLKVYSRAACRSCEKKYPFFNSVPGRHFFFNIDKMGRGSDATET